MTLVAFGKATQDIAFGGQTLEIQLGDSTQFAAAQAALAQGVLGEVEVLADASASSALAAAQAAAIEGRKPTIGDFVRWQGGANPVRVDVTETPGLAYMKPDGFYAFTTSGTQQRPHYQGGVLAGFYLHRGSINWIGGSAQARALTGANQITGVGSGSGGAPVVAGSNAYADRFGTTGECLVIPQRSVGGFERRWDGAGVAVTTGQLVRGHCVFQIGGTPSAASTFTPIILRASSGSAPGGRYTATINADGTVSSALTIAGVPERGFLEQIGTLGGRPLYRYWFETLASANGTIYPACIEPAAAIGIDIIWHDRPLIAVNPQAPPTILPIGGAKAIAASRLSVGSVVQQFDVDFWRLARGHSRQPGTAIDVPNPAVQGNRTAISGPMDEWEDWIEVRPASEATGVAVILPSANSLFDSQLLPSFRSPDLRMKGYFADAITSPSSGAAGSYTLRGQSATDWLKLPWIAFNTSPTYTTAITGSWVNYWATSEFLSQEGQEEVSNNKLGRLAASSAITMEIGGLVSHPYTHSRLRRQEYADPTPEERNYVGTMWWSNADTITIDNCIGMNIGRLFELNAGGAAAPMAVTVRDSFFTNFSSDYHFYGDGDFSVTHQGCIIDRNTAVDIMFLQSAPDCPVMVNFGSGWQSVVDYAAAEGITVPAALERLPKNRWFSYYGTLPAYNAGSPRSLPGSVLVNPDPLTRFRLAHWVIDNGAVPYNGNPAAANVPGFQWHQTLIERPDGTLSYRADRDTAWLSTGDGAASPTNPHIMLCPGLGLHTLVSGVVTWQAGAGAGGAYAAGMAVAEATGTHGDIFQKNPLTTRWSNFLFEDSWIRSNAQVFFGGGVNTTATGIGTFLVRRSFFGTPFGNFVRLGDAIGGPLVFQDCLIMPTLDPWRFRNGLISTPAMTLEEADIDVSQNVWMGAVASGASTENTPTITYGGSTAGRVFVGAVKRIRVGTVLNNVVTEAAPVVSGGAVTKPIWPMFLDKSARAEFNDRGYCSYDAPIWLLAFSDYAMAMLGCDLNYPRKRIFERARNFLATYLLIRNELGKDPEAHGEVLNTAAVGDEVVVYEDFDGAKQNVLRLPGYTIDPFWSGWGRSPFVRLTDEGRFVVARALAFGFPLNRFLRVITRAPDGSFGPVITIDCRAP